MKNEKFTKNACIIVVFLQHILFNSKNSSKINENLANYCNFSLNCNYNLINNKGKKQ